MHETSGAGTGNVNISTRVSSPSLSFYFESQDGTYSPRCVFADTDPSTTTDLRAGLQELNSELLSFKLDCRSNFFEGRSQASNYTFADSVIERVRNQAEKCDNLGGLLNFRSIGGGTGSGIGNEVLRSLSDEFPKKCVFDQIIYPSTDSSVSTVEPYNSVFSLTDAIPLASLSLLLDNQAAFRICRSKLGVSNPSFSDVNGIIERVVSGATASLRHRSTLNASMSEIVTNLVPDPTFRYGIVSLFPFRNSRNEVKKFSSNEFVSSLFEAGSCLCDTPRSTKDRFFSASVLCEGSSPLPVVEMQKAINRMRNGGVKFVPWIPTSFKVGIVESRSSPISVQGVMVANTTAANGLFIREYRKFLQLFFHKAYVWQFLEAGGEMDDFISARECMRNLIAQYSRVVTDCAEEDASALLNKLTTS